MKNSAPRPEERISSAFTTFSHSSPSAGFTLIELLVSISILAILAAAGMPQLSGMYERQKLTNAANQLVSDIKALQNKALANDQDRFAVAEANDGPLFDCIPGTSGKPYVEGYRMDINADGGGYTSEFVFRPKNNADVACPQPTEKVSTTLLPTSVRFSGYTANSPIKFQSVTGMMYEEDGTGKKTPVATPQQLVLVNDRLSQTALTFYVCITPGRVYAQSDVCL
jgi:prepilin-type N-terminal cleavage/methylation domain-containing protein